MSLRRPEGLTDPDQVRIWEKEFRVTPEYNLDAPVDQPQVDRNSKETLSPAIMSMLATRCPNLEELHLVCLNVNANNLSIINALPKSLTTLSIVHCNFFNLDPTKSPFFGIDKQLPGLKVRQFIYLSIILYL